MTTYWLAVEETVTPLTREAEAHALATLGRSRFGETWLLVAAPDEADAKNQAVLFFQMRHPDQREILLFAQAYRAGAVDLPHDPSPNHDKALYPRTPKR